MNTSPDLHDVLRLLRNLIRIGTFSEVNFVAGHCRVEIASNTID